MPVSVEAYIPGAIMGDGIKYKCTKYAFDGT